MAIVRGTNNSERIDGSDGVTNGDDTIFGFVGNDTIFGLGGDDRIQGGLGADTIDGGAGFDQAMYLDSAVGVSVNLATGRGAGGTAEGDTLTSIEAVYGSSHNDTLVGNSGVNDLYGLAGNDVLKGGAGVDRLDGGEGNDILKGGGGADFLSGGAGIDTADYSEAPTTVQVDIFNNNNLFNDAQGDTLVGIENLRGSAFSDTLRGDDGANNIVGLDGADSIDGRGGVDVLIGGAGRDQINGGAGADTMVGGAGEDVFFVDNATDVVREAADEGDGDTVFTSVDYTLPAGAAIEFLVPDIDISLSTPLKLTGNEFANRIVSNTGDDVLNGGGGADSMQGNKGNDFYFVDNAGDSIDEESGAGALDRVFTSVSYTLGAGDEIETFSTTDIAGAGALNLTGNEFSNTIFGNAGSNALKGLLGNDTLVGLGGIDAFVFNTALNGSSNVDTISDFSPVDDEFDLASGIFPTLAPGTLAASAFVTGAAALDADDRIIYNNTTGALIFDADGTGAGAAVQFATVTANLALTNADFIVL